MACPNCGAPGGGPSGCGSCGLGRDPSVGRAFNTGSNYSGGGGGGGSGCFSATTRVRTPSGWARISELSIGDTISTFRPSDTTIGQREVFKIRHLQKRKCMRIATTSDNVLEVTKGHPLLTDSGWAPAKKLVVGGSLLNFNHDCLESDEITSIEEKTTVEDVYHLYCGFDHTYIVEHAVSHCFAYARGLRGFSLDARSMLKRALQSTENALA